MQLFVELLFATKIMSSPLYDCLPVAALGRNNLGAAGFCPCAENSGLTGTCGFGAGGLKVANAVPFPDVPRAPNKAWAPSAIRRGCSVSGDVLGTSPPLRFTGGTINDGRCSPVATRICGSEGSPLLIC